MTTSRDRFFTVRPTSPKKEKNTFHPELETIDESKTISRINSKEDVAKGVRILLNHDGCYSPRKR